MTQSIADLVVGEEGQSENYSSITNYHDKIQSAVQLVSKNICFYGNNILNFIMMKLIV